MSGSSGTDRMPVAATTNGAAEGLTRFGSHHPLAGFLVEGHRDDLGVELDVAAKIEPVGDEVQIGLDLGLGRHRLRPHPFLLNLFGEAVGVLDAFDVTSCTRVPVEQPGAADVFGHLQHPGPHSELPQPMQHVQAGEPGADNQHVEVRVIHHRQLLCRSAGWFGSRCRLLIRRMPSACRRSRDSDPRRATRGRRRRQAGLAFAQAMRNFYGGTHRRPTWRKAGTHEGFRQVGLKPRHIKQLNRRYGRVWVPKVGWVRFRWTRTIPATVKSYRVSSGSIGALAHRVCCHPRPCHGTRRRQRCGCGSRRGRIGCAVQRRVAVRSWPSCW